VRHRFAARRRPVVLPVDREADMRDQPPIKLYTDAFWISPYVFTVFVALHEKGLPFETVNVALQEGEQRAPRYRDRSVTGRVPAIEHGGFFLAESQAIVDYLDEAFPDAPRLLPEGLHERARARSVLGWIRSDLLALREERGTHTMFYERAAAPLSDQGRAAADKLLRVAELLLPTGQTSLFGAWSIADSDLAFMLHRLILNGEEVPARLRAFAEAQWARPSTHAFVDRARPPYVPYG
jgi:glutathione S-transferase